MTHSKRSHRCRLFAKVLWLALLSLAVASRARACSCGSAGPCDAHRHFGTVFLGTVLNVRTVDNEHRSADGTMWRGGGHRIVTIRIEEDFSGRYGTGRLVEVTTGMGGGDCGYTFREGIPYVVDAYGDEDALSTGICSNTREAAEAALLLRDLRRADGVAPPDVSGAVVLRCTKRDWLAPPPKPLASIPVTMTSVGGVVYRTATDADGVYQFAVLPWSAYSIHFELPDNLMSFDKDNTLALALPFTNGHGGAGCELGLTAYSAGGFAGQVLDEHGNGVAGTVWVNDHSPFESQQGASSALGVAGADGTFHITPLEDGVYWLSFRSAKEPRRQWFYPGVPAPEGGASLTVEGGRITSGIRLIVTP